MATLARVLQRKCRSPSPRSRPRLGALGDPQADFCTFQSRSLFHVGESDRMPGAFSTHRAIPFANAEPRHHIVWADGNADMRAYVGSLLASRYEVETVPDAEAALTAKCRQIPDLVLADVKMHRLYGRGLLRA